jgi:MYXO-CTERM domain-containing protein
MGPDIIVRIVAAVGFLVLLAILVLRRRRAA